MLGSISMRLLICTIILVKLNLFLFVDAGPRSLPISTGDCTYEYEGRTMREGEYVAIGRKFYKIEDCNLHRAYRTCGKHLWFILNIACDSIQDKERKPSRRNVDEVLLTDACCRNACTVAEMTRYCPE